MCDACNTLSYHLRRASTDARINLIKYHTRGSAIMCCRNRLDSQRNARKLSARRHLLQQPFFLTNICRKINTDDIMPCLSISFRSFDSNAKLCLWHAERIELFFNSASQALRRFFTCLCHCRRPFFHDLIALRNLSLHRIHRRIIVFQTVELFTQLFLIGKHIGNRHTVLLPELIKRIHSRLKFIELFRTKTYLLAVITKLVGGFL